MLVGIGLENTHGRQSIAASANGKVVYNTVGNIPIQE